MRPTTCDGNGPGKVNMLAPCKMAARRECVVTAGRDVIQQGAGPNPPPLQPCPGSGLPSDFGFAGSSKTLQYLSAQ